MRSRLRIFPLILSMLAVSSSAHAVPPVYEWGQSLGTMDFRDLSDGVAVDGSGNVVVVGHSVPGPRGQFHSVIAKYNAGGMLQWSRAPVGTLSNVARGVAVDVAGNVLVVGSFNGTVNFGGGDLVNAGDYHDMFVVKYDANGSHLWSRSFGNRATDAAWGVAVDASGDVLITGYFNYSADFGGGPLVSAGSTDILVAKYDANGVHQWSRRLGGPDADFASGIAVDASGNVFITGTFYGTAFVAKYDASGVPQWSRHLEGTPGASGEGIAVDARGNVIVTGYFYGTVTLGGGDLVSAGSRDIYLAEYDGNGAHQWSRRFGGTANDEGLGVAADSAGNVLVTGYFEDTVDFGGGDLVGAGSWDIFVAEYDENGMHRWSRSAGDTGYDQGSGVTVDAAGEVVFAGYFSGTVDLGGGDLVSEGWEDIFVAKYDDRTAVDLDIEPGSCPNPLNVTAPGGGDANGGVLPVAVLGGDGFDVHDIDVSTLSLAGATPLRSSYRDVAASPGDDDDCTCAEARVDGYADLVLEFSRLDVAAGLDRISGGSMPVTLTGRLMDGPLIVGTDCVRIVPGR